MNIKLKLFFYLIFILVSSQSLANDSDSDGIDDSVDNCVSVANADQVDTDSDAIGNACDADDDGDNIEDIFDVFPLDFLEVLDTDVDGIGNNTDQDDDNDGLQDSEDPNPLLPIEYIDIDNDGINNILDADDDGDGIVDSQDSYPFDATYGKDSDNDGLPDAFEALHGYLSFDSIEASGDADLDGLPNLWEKQNGRDPLTSDVQVILGGVFCTKDDFGLKCRSGGAPTRPVYGFKDMDSRGCLIDIKGLHCWSSQWHGTKYLQGAPELNYPTKLLLSESGAITLDNSEWKFWYSQGYTPEFSDPVNHVQVGDGICTTEKISGDQFHFFCWGMNMPLAQYFSATLPSSPISIGLADGGLCYIYRDGSENSIDCFDNSGGKAFKEEMGELSLSNPRQVIGRFSLYVLDDNGVHKIAGRSYNQHLDPEPPALKNPKQLFIGSRGICAVDDTGLVCWGKSTSSNFQDVDDHYPIFVDADNDGYRLGLDAFPFDASEHLDSDLDGVGDNADAFPTDATETLDTDSDGIGDNSDNCPNTSNPDQLNSDVDNLGNACDEDDDNDGIADASDAFPLDPAETLDTDSDGIGNNADTDDDDDGVADGSDAFPLDATETIDTDSDGMGDSYETKYNLDINDPSDASSDIDGDSLSALEEFILGTSPIYNDTDWDSLPDNWEIDNGRDPLVADYQLSIGDSYACAIDDSGVVCWGRMDNLGTAPSSFNNPTGLAVGRDHSCALDTAGVVCWGNYREPASDVTSISSNNKSVTHVAVNVGHTFWVNNEGLVWKDRSGLYGPNQVNNVRQLSAMNQHYCLLDDSGVYCNGQNDYGQTSTPTLTNPTHISAGVQNSCAVDETGVVCWGRANRGVNSIPALSNPTQVSVGKEFACALDDTGVVCWGSPTYDAGQTNVPSELNASNPYQVSVGSWYACALSDTGLTCWGDSNFAGVLPDNEPNLWIDPDGDGYASHGGDTFPLDANEWLDTDSDGTGNNADSDDDGDGVLDDEDAFPLNADEAIDTDSDGIGNNSDPDDDGDGVDDVSDAFPLDASESTDTDADGLGDNSDPFPENPLYTLDSDSDGMPDAWETRYGLDPNDASDASSDQDDDGVSALDEFLAGTIPSGSLDIDGNENYDALTDGLLLLRGMFGLDGSALVSGTIASDASYTESVDIESRIATLGELADIDGNGQIDALTDGLLTLRYLFGLEGDTLINGVVAGDATRKTAEEIEAHLETLMPAL